MELTDNTSRILSRSVLTGPQSTFKMYAATGRTGIVIARIRPGAAAPFLRVPLSDLRDRNVPLDDLVAPGLVRRLERRIGEADSSAARVQALDAFLLSLLRLRGVAPDVGEEIAWIVTSGGARPIRDLVRASGLSPRKLQRRFRDGLGLSPKTFSRLVRLQSALHLRDTGLSWSRTAHSTGYQDQSHLINDCKALSGLSPSQVIRRRHATPLAAFYNVPSNGAPFSETTYL
jgi:AraC-like DNA-binding protein